MMVLLTEESSKSEFACIKSDPLSLIKAACNLLMLMCQPFSAGKDVRFEMQYKGLDYISMTFMY